MMPIPAASVFQIVDGGAVPQPTATLNLVIPPLGLPDSTVTRIKHLTEKAGRLSDLHAAQLRACPRQVHLQRRHPRTPSTPYLLVEANEP
jgi:hypothetical protein